MSWIIGLLIVAVYFAVGRALARRGLPGAWRRAREEWTFDDIARGSVQAYFILMILFWPLMGAWRFIVDTTQRAVDAGDPVKLEQENRRLVAEVQRLERELDIR